MVVILEEPTHCRGGNYLENAIQYSETARFIHTHRYMSHRMAGNFHGVLIFIIFVVDSAVMKINGYQNAHTRKC